MSANNKKYMELIKWEPFNELDRFFGDVPLINSRKLGWDMAVDIYEQDGNSVVKMNVPGLAPEDIDIFIEKELLTISGSRKDEKEVQKKDYYSKEIRRGSFSRTIPLQKPVDTKKTVADYKDGVLTIVMPSIKGAKSSAVKIQIKR